MKLVRCGDDYAFNINDAVMLEQIEENLVSFVTADGKDYKLPGKIDDYVDAMNACYVPSPPGFYSIAAIQGAIPGQVEFYEYPIVAWKILDDIEVAEPISFDVFTKGICILSRVIRDPLGNVHPQSRKGEFFQESAGGTEAEWKKIIEHFSKTGEKIV